MAALPPLSEPAPPVQPQSDVEIEPSPKPKRSLFKKKATPRSGTALRSPEWPLF